MGAGSKQPALAPSTRQRAGSTPMTHRPGRGGLLREQRAQGHVLEAHIIHIAHVRLGGRLHRLGTHCGRRASTAICCGRGGGGGSGGGGTGTQPPPWSPPGGTLPCRRSPVRLERPAGPARWPDCRRPALAARPLAGARQHAVACILGLDCRWLSRRALAMGEAWSCCRCRRARCGLQATVPSCQMLAKGSRRLLALLASGCRA